MDFYQNFVQFVERKENQIYALCPFHKEKVPSFTIIFVVSNKPS